MAEICGSKRSAAELQEEEAEHKKMKGEEKLIMTGLSEVEIKERLGEAGSLRSLNDHRLLLVLEMLEGRGLLEERDSLLAFVSTKEALLRVKNTCEQLERSILA